MSASMLHASNAPEKLTRGHKKKARTRQTLLEAAMEIYAQEGISTLTLNDLATKANVSNGTIYNYFKTREDVLEAVSIELANQFSDYITLVSSNIESGSHRTVIGIRMFIQRALVEPNWARALLHIVHYDKGMRSVLANAVRKDLNAGLNEGIFKYIDEEIALTLFISSAIGLLINIVEERYREGDDLKLIEMLLKALGVDATLAPQIARLEIPQGSISSF
ncbi:TetR/AcrR family transcriptional regulator [Acinetobacter modestus]|uniref:TetR/AcrR family transcriptional regulator n=1 Tax=Acinetobacter modestus TaxID=1776740 RepID=UPI0020306B2A|nr:TetR/AcrR family transcriptional regulator [Acinetobacter modestus]MCM1958225.1 TetR/AcrR family transcriptional regulator [Acinetobacter modestus]